MGLISAVGSLPVGVIRALNVLHNVGTPLVEPKMFQSLDKLEEKPFDPVKLNNRLKKQGFSLPSKTLIDFEGATEYRKKDFETFEKQRQAGLDALLNSSNKSIKDKLDSIPEKDKETLNNIMKDKFKEMAPSLETVKTQINDSANAITSVDSLYALKAPTETAITAQRELDKQNLKRLFDEPSEFKDKINAVLNPDEIVTLKASMASEIDKTHQKNLDSLNKKNDELIIELDRQSQQNFAKLVYLASLRSNNAIKSLIASAKSDLDAVKVSIGESHIDAATDIDLNELNDKDVRTTTGQSIIFDPATKTVSMKLPHRFLDFSRLLSGEPLYYASLANKVKQDMKTMALRIKAEGYDVITFNIKHKDFEHARFIALQAFAGSREVGLREENIKINVNGKLMPLYSKFDADGKEIEKGIISDPNGKDSPEKKAIDLKAERFEKGAMAFITKDGREASQFEKYKTEVFERRAAERAKNAETAPAPPDSPASPAP